MLHEECDFIKARDIALVIWVIRIIEIVDDSISSNEINRCRS
jgi:hypothetical protein